MKEVKAGRSASYLWFLAALVGFVLFSTFLVLYFYRSVFSGEISANANDWSVFGTYVGGVLGPVISFVALIGLLVTAKLQRDTFLLQERQYFDIAQQQVESTNAQKHQIEIATATLEYGRVNNYKAMVLQVLQHRVDIHNQAVSTINEKMYTLTRLFMDEPKLCDSLKIDDLASSRDEHQLQANKVAGMVLALALEEHASVHAFKIAVLAALKPDNN